ncbi:MAG: 50S ribosomal protein L28 [Alphaproteobacteria bacterium]
MSKRCELTSKTGITGNNVSHANNKSKRRFEPNLQYKAIMSDILGRSIRLRLTTRALRTIERAGGFDAFLMKTPEYKLSKSVALVKKHIELLHRKKNGEARQRIIEES